MKSPKPDSEPLSNPRHEAFAREVASGNNAAVAYAAVYGAKNHHAASTAGYRLLHRPSVACRIKSIQEAAAQGVAMDLREIHHFLTRVVRTPAGAVTPSSDLCLRVKVTPAGKETRMPSKLACVQLSAKLQGFFPHQAKPAAPSPPVTDNPHVLTEERLAVIGAAKPASVLAELGEAEQKTPRQKERPPGEPARRSGRLGDQQLPLISRVKAQKISEMTNNYQPFLPANSERSNDLSLTVGNRPAESRQGAVASFQRRDQSPGE